MSSSSKAGPTTNLPTVTTSGPSQACDNSRNVSAGSSSLSLTAESILTFDATSASMQHIFKKLKDEVASLCKHLEALVQTTKRSWAKTLHSSCLTFYRTLTKSKGIRLDEECPLVIIGYTCLQMLKQLLSRGKTAQQASAILRNMGAHNVEEDEYACLRDELLSLSNANLVALAELSLKDEVALQLSRSLWWSCGSFCLFDGLFRLFVRQYTLRTYQLDLTDLATHLDALEAVNITTVSSMAGYLAEIQLMFINIYVAIKPLEIRKLDICLQYLQMILHDTDVRDNDKSMLAACIRTVLTLFDKAELRLGMLGAQALSEGTLIIESPNDQENSRTGTLPPLGLPQSSYLGCLCSQNS